MYKYFEQLRPYVEEWQKGIDCETTDGHRVLISPEIILSVADYPGQLCMHGASKTGCLWCGERPNLKYANYVWTDFRKHLPPDHPFRTQARFGLPCTAPSPLLRTHSENMLCGEAAELHNESKSWKQELLKIGHQKSRPPWAAAGCMNLDSVKDASPDSMHQGLFYQLF
jgi:hypothetical protein